MGTCKARGLGITLFALLLFNSTNSHSRTEYDKWLRKEFKAIQKRDQSNVRNNEVRDTLILYNFNLINKYFREDKMRTFQDSTLTEKTLRIVKVGLIITYIHILQTNTLKLLNKEIVDEYKGYLDNEVLTHFTLESAVNTYTTDMNHQRWGPCTDELRNNYEYAIKTCDLKLGKVRSKR